MGNVPVSGPYAQYCGKRFLILFSGDDWVALRADSETEVPTAALDGIVDVDVTGSLDGHRVSLRNLLSDGRIRVWFIGDPAVAEDIGLKGDRHDGWTGSFDPEDFSDIQIAETRRV